MQKSKAILGTLKVFSITGKYLLKSYRRNFDILSLKKNWSIDVLNHLNIEDQVINYPADLRQDEPIIFVGNHISYLDIPLLLKIHPKITFVSKNEIRYWPVIGKAATKCNTIFVKRQNKLNKNKAKEKIASELKTFNKHIVVFPSGTTSEFQSIRWNKGIFEIASTHKIKIVPFKIKFNHSRLAAYIDDDQFLKHLSKVFSNNLQLSATVEFKKPRLCQLNDMEEIKNWCES
jgi:1-acyl-sn-glycerol-3-phosphate acyltransferase